MGEVTMPDMATWHFQNGVLVSSRFLLSFHDQMVVVKMAVSSPSPLRFHSESARRRCYRSHHDQIRQRYPVAVGGEFTSTGGISTEVLDQNISYYFVKYMNAF